MLPRPVSLVAVFARWGRFVYRFRWATLVVSALLLALSIVSVLTGGMLAGNGGFCAAPAAGQTPKPIAPGIPPPNAAHPSVCLPLFSTPPPQNTQPPIPSAL